MNKYIKVTNKDIYVPQKLLEHIIRETDVMPITIEEEQSEIFFGSLSGLGKMIFKNETVYEGNVKYGILDSGEEKRNCTITFPNNTRYDGQIKLNQITGNGTYTFESGSIYTGDVKNGLRNGFGVYTTQDGIKYEGQWLNGLKHGMGNFIIKDNMTYEGEWQEGIKQGHGRIKWASGNIYDGEFKGNKINGNGYMIWYDTNEKYTGQWVDNYQNGFGIQIWYENKGEQKYLRNRYVGEWRNGFRHGYGIFFYSNGSKYEGMWDQNYKHGFGVFTFQDGSQYIGRFHSDKMIEYNIYGFSIPNGLKPQNERVSTANSRQGNNNKLKNTGAISRLGNQTNKLKEDSFNNENQKVEKDDPKSKSQSSNVSIKISQDVSINNNNQIINNLGNKDHNTPNSNANNSNKEATIGLIKPLNLNSSNSNNNLNNNIIANSNLEMISEQAELFNLSVMINENNKYGKENYFNNIYNSNFNINNNPNPNSTLASNLDPQGQNQTGDKKDKNKDSSNTNEQNRNNNNQNKEKKESEYNVFKTLIDISDLLEADPDLENHLREVENTMLRHLSEMKMWYRYYTNKDFQKEENPSVNASVIEDKISSKDLFVEKKLSLNHHSHKDSSNKDVQLLKSIYPNNPQTSSHLLEGIYSNDLAFAMELRDLWRFLRESNILNSEFTLAQFNRLFFKGPKNYIEMFMYPEEITNNTRVYDYIYFMISKAKEEFMTKHREKLLTSNITNNLFGGGYNNTTTSTNNNYFNLNNMLTDRNILQDSNNDTSNVKGFEAESFNDNIHNKHQTILLRHFYEAILRSAYLRYAHINIPLHSKINNLIDTCIKTNINFKKVNRKSQMHTESSINSSVIVDMKVKSFERDLESFLGNFEIRLKKAFKNLYLKSAVIVKKDDITVTYRFFYDNVVKKSENLLALYDKPKFIELINIYHKDKIVIQENQKISRELFCYIENLLDMEFIFYEFCELVFFVTRKLLQKNNLTESKDNYSNQIEHIEALIEQCESVKIKDRFYYKFPKLNHHIAYENIIKTQIAKEEEERRRILELKRIEFERKMMQIEDTNILPEFIEEDENEEYSSDYSNY